MSLGTETTIMIALIPFLAVWGLLALARALERRRQARVFRQIALTDAIHRELGAAVCVLCSDGSGFITGHVLPHAGGWA